MGAAGAPPAAAGGSSGNDDDASRSYDDAERVGRVRVRVLRANRLPRAAVRSARTCFFVTALCDHAEGAAAAPLTPRSPWPPCPNGGAALPPLGRIEWLTDADAAAAEEGAVELAFTEIATDLVLQLRRAEDGGSAGEVLGEVCLPLAMLAAAAAPRGGAALGAPIWHELLLPREHGLQRQRTRPEKGQPGWLHVQVSVTLATHERVAYASLPYAPHPERNLWDPTKPKHPELGVISAVFGVQHSVARVDAALRRLVFGCVAAPLRTACFLQTWRAPRLNAGFALLAYAFTTRTGFRLGASCKRAPVAPCGSPNQPARAACAPAAGCAAPLQAASCGRCGRGAGCT
jgi:hypothetical protein